MCLSACLAPNGVSVKAPDDLSGCPFCDNKQEIIREGVNKLLLTDLKDLLQMKIC